MKKSYIKIVRSINIKYSIIFFYYKILRNILNRYYAASVMLARVNKKKCTNTHEFLLAV